MDDTIRIEALDNGNSFKPETIRLASIALTSAIAGMNFDKVSTTEDELQELIDFLDGMVKTYQVDEFRELHDA